jgi:hypothetical protein
MKKIETYIEGVEDGEVLPSIKGIILSVKVNEEEGKQTIKITDSEGDTINIFAKDKAAWVINPSEGAVLSMTSSGKGGVSKGLTFKVNKKNNIAYIVASAGVTSSVEPVSVSVTEEEQEPLTAADHTIDSLVLDRLYIFSRVKKIVREMNSNSIGIDFPEDKIPELTTSIHMDLKYMNISPRPTDKQLERKKVHKETHAKKKEVKAPVEEPPKRTKTQSDGWKDFIHPVSKERLGDVSSEKMATQFLPWYYRTEPASLKPEIAELHRAIGLAREGLKITPQMVLEQYITFYAKEYAPNSEKRRNRAIIKFCEGLVEHKVTKNDIRDGSVTETEAASALKNFGNLWKEIIETE